MPYQEPIGRIYGPDGKVVLTVMPEPKIVGFVPNEKRNGAGSTDERKGNPNGIA